MLRNARIQLRRFWRVHRLRLAIGLAVLPVLAAMAHSAIGADDGHQPRITRGEYCRALESATRDAAARYSSFPRAASEASVKEACSRGPVYAQDVEAKRIAASPGCHLLLMPGTRRPPRPRPRIASPPRQRIPFFARRSGSLPPSGTPVVGGVRLPEGSRCAPFWSTDAGVEDAWGLARRLTAVFPKTGLWPVVWEWESEEPDSYANGHGDPARADRLDAGTLLRRSWKANGFARERPFPGMATAEARAQRLGVDPFGEIVQASLLDAPPPGGWIVMLVPVNRPADVYSVLRPQLTEFFGDYELTAVLRSWEERFGAVVTALSPSTVELAVGAPPRDGKQARRLAAEQAAFAPEDDGTRDLGALARRLRSSRVLRGLSSAYYWAFGWPD